MGAMPCLQCTGHACVHQLCMPTVCMMHTYFYVGMRMLPACDRLRRALNVPTKVIEHLASQKAATGVEALLVHISTDQVGPGCWRR